MSEAGAAVNESEEPTTAASFILKFSFGYGQLVYVGYNLVVNAGRQPFTAPEVHSTNPPDGSQYSRPPQPANQDRQSTSGQTYGGRSQMSRGGVRTYRP